MSAMIKWQLKQDWIHDNSPDLIADKLAYVEVSQSLIDRSGDGRQQIGRLLTMSKMRTG